MNCEAAPEGGAKFLTNISQIDEAILSAVGERWTKVAMVIARVEKAMDIDVERADEVGELIARRVEGLVQDGSLEVAGQIKNWRFSEVRLRPET